MPFSSFESAARDLYPPSLSRSRDAPSARAWHPDRRGEVDPIEEAACQASAIVHWILPELLELIADCHDQPVDELRPAIRRLIEERAFAYACADDAATCIDHHVDLIVHMLEQVRRQASEHDDWSAMQTSATMFG